MLKLLQYAQNPTLLCLGFASSIVYTSLRHRVLQAHAGYITAACGEDAFRWNKAAEWQSSIVYDTIVMMIYVYLWFHPGPRRSVSHAGEEDPVYAGELYKKIYLRGTRPSFTYHAMPRLVSLGD